jgi:hypothetical protein
VGQAQLQSVQGAARQQCQSLQHLKAHLHLDIRTGQLNAAEESVSSLKLCHLPVPLLLVGSILTQASEWGRQRGGAKSWCLQRGGGNRQRAEDSAAGAAGGVTASVTVVNVAEALSCGPGLSCCLQICCETALPPLAERREVQAE